MRKLVFFLLLGILAGIGFFILLEDFNIYVFLFFGLISIFFYFKKKDLVFISLGIVLAFSLSFVKFDSYKLIEKENRDLKITILEKRKSGTKNRYLVEAYDFKENIKEKSVFYSTEDFQIGDIFLANADISLPLKNTNPYFFNFRSYLLSKNIKSILSLNKYKYMGKSKNILLRLKKSFYAYINGIFAKNLDAESSKFVTSLVLGQNLIENENIRSLGLAHLFAVSGLHIDLLLAIMLKIFEKLNMNYKYSKALSLVLCLLYAYMISFPFSVIRVLIENFISYLAFLAKRPEDKINSLMLAAIFILLLSPFAFLNLGFVLSFVAKFSILIIYPSLRPYFSKNMLSGELAFISSVQLGLFPFMLYYTGRVNLLSLLANYLIVAIFEILVLLVFATIIFYPLLFFLKGLVFGLIEIFVNMIVTTVDTLGKISIFKLSFARTSIRFSILLFVFIIVFIKTFHAKTFYKKMFFGGTLLIFSLSIIEGKMENDCKFSMIDIGQGDAFIFENHGKVYLFDLGGPKYDGYDSAKDLMLPLLEAKGIKEIEAVFISHLDKDHAGNLEEINESFKVKKVFSSYLNEEGLEDYNFYPLSKGDRIKLKDANIDVVFDGGGESVDENNKSLGLLLNIKGSKILMLGDLESSYEDKLDLTCDILKVSHHGSASSTSKAFVEKTRPKVALISAGRNNTYGHPRKEVLENLKDTKIYNTQTDGLVEIRFKDKNFEVEPYLKGGFFR
jgi:competence protein ComEC